MRSALVVMAASASLRVADAEGQDFATESFAWENDNVSLEGTLYLPRGQVYRTETGWDEARAAVAAARSQPWFDNARLGIQERDSWNWKWYRDLPFDFDPMPLLRALHVPLLAAHGERDGLVPATRSATTIDSLAAAGKRYASVVFPDVGHVLHTVTGAPSSRSWKAPAAYWRTLTDWLRDNGILR